MIYNSGTSYLNSTDSTRILVPITRQMTAPNGAKFGTLYDLGLVADNNSSASYVETSEVDTDGDGSLDWQEYITGTDRYVADGLEGVLNVVSNGVEISTSPAVAGKTCQCTHPNIFD